MHRTDDHATSGSAFRIKLVQHTIEQHSALRRDIDCTAAVVVVTVSGDVDLLTASAFADGIDTALEKSPVGVVIDLTRVEFLGALGISVLVAARERSSTTLVWAVVAEVPCQRLLRLTGADASLPLHASTMSALDSVLAEQSCRCDVTLPVSGPRRPQTPSAASSTPDLANSAE